MSINCLNFDRTNLRAEYWYVQINIDEDQRVEYVMHVFDNQPKMMKLVPKYHKELKEKKIETFSSTQNNQSYNYNNRSLIEEVVE